MIHTHWHSVHFVIANDWLSIAQHDSQPLAQHDSPLFTTTGLA
jgi:hypothetical protein